MINQKFKSEIILRRVYTLALFSFFFFLFSTNCYSQETIPRKKIGLVLSGGGAKGFAHIGVLKVLETAGIKIDYIGGTSMGAVVGGLYASGYNATQIDSIFKKIKFDELLQDYNPRTSKSFYEKRNDEIYAISLPFNKFSLGIPVALSKGLYNYNVLNQLTKKVRHVRDFSKLPIPFLCIATDIETGAGVILDKGYLPQAMLASSAFPTLFSPVEIDGRLLIDGGVTNNYPVDEVRKMGADIIIGVDVQDDLKDRNSLRDATRILVQISNLQMVESIKEKISKTDIYIKPDISGYNVISFDDRRDIVKKGEEASFTVYEKLLPLGNKETYKLQSLKNVNDSIQINRISFSNLNNFTRAYVIGKLGFKQPSKVSYTDLKNGINKLNATQNFSSISYNLNELDNGDDLNLTLTESKNKTFLKFGLHYDDLYKSAILVNLTQKKSIFRNDVLSLDLVLGDNFRYNLDYYVDNGFYFSFGFKSRLNQFNRNVSTDYSNGSLFTSLDITSLNVDFLDINNQAYVQTVFSQKFLIGAGIEWKHLRIRSKTLNNSASVFENSDYGSAFSYITYDSFDNKYFPRKGLNFNGTFQTYLFSNNYYNQFNRFSTVKGELGIAGKLYTKTTLKVQSSIGLAIGEESVSYLDFVFGGYGYNTINNFNHFYGYDFISLAADSFVKTAATIDYEIFKKNHLNFSANFAIIEDALFEKVDWIDRKKQSGYAVGYGLETIIGPIEFKYSWSPDNPRPFAWLSAGFWF
jgi:NTE family protein